MKDFLAIEVISSLDTFFFFEYVKSREICKQILTEDKHHGILEIQATTSKDAKEDKFVHDKATVWINEMRKQGTKNKKLNKKLRPTPHSIHIGFTSREWFFEMPMFLIYKVMRKVFVSFWFYFSPFLAMTLQFLIPFFDQSYKSSWLVSYEK